MKLRLIVAAVSLATVPGVLPSPLAAAVSVAADTTATEAAPAGTVYARAAARRDCPLGKVYSTFHRRCVWWLPLRT